MFEYSGNDFYKQFKKFLFVIKMFCQRSEAAFGRNDHKRCIVETRNAMRKLSFKYRLKVPFFNTCLPPPGGVLEISSDGDDHIYWV